MPTPTPGRSCTAFDHHRRVASGSYVAVAIAVRELLRTSAEASVLIFDDRSGEQIDFDCRGSDHEIAECIGAQFPDAAQNTRPVGRPRLGVVSREVTLLPRHWQWLAEQPGGASVTLRRLVEEARRAGPSAAAEQRRRHERSYRFMSAIAGNLDNFEEAARALFANNLPALRALIAGWPPDIRGHILELATASV